MTEAPVFDLILDELGKVVQARTVLGDPIQVGELTLVPVVDISVGFGGGLGEAPGHNGDRHGGGQGGGGGAHVSPRAVIVVKDGTPEVLQVGSGVALERVLEAAPAILQGLRPPRRHSENGQ